MAPPARLLLLIAAVVLCGIAAALPHPERFSALRMSDQPELQWNASVTIDLGKKKPISSVLYGIFFEEIGHAGDGGLYAEMVQDRSFDALAAATGFHAASAPPRLPLDLPALAALHRRPDEPLRSPGREGSEAKGRSYASKAEFLKEQREGAEYDPLSDIIVAWQPLPGTSSSLTKDQPLNEHNTVAMELTAQSGPRSGIVNTGYWGVYVQKGHSYTVSLYARTRDAEGKTMSVALLNADLTTSYANLTLAGVTGEWQRFEGELKTSDTDTNARLAVMFEGPGSLVIDAVSMFPTENVEKGEGLANPWPFRDDLLGALKALDPAFVRFPGGCYVEGDVMSNAFRWKNTLGKYEERPGHMNGVWGYWSTDGLGLFEYMLLVEELQAEAVWVINNGVAHGDSVPASQVWPMVQEALDSIEFITGAPDSKWGAVRAAMGRKDPWELNFMAIGNEDCWYGQYRPNYLLFFGAIRARYPHITLISNCDMGQDAPTDTWDWHLYTNPVDLFNKRTTFDGWTPQNNHYVFASEYAVTDGGGWGNTIGAVAEAAFMTGMERNGDVVTMGSYAPLFVHWNNRPWPTNMIVIDNARWFGIPSYHVQQMFRQAQGTHYLATDVLTDPASEVHQDSVAASATCQSAACDRIALKIVNFSSFRQRIAVVLHGQDAASVMEEGEMVYLTSDHPEDENSFEHPDKVSPASSTVDGLGSKFVLPLQPYSVNILSLHLSSSPSANALHAGADSGTEGVAAA